MKVKRTLENLNNQTRSFFETVGDEDSELSYESDAVYPENMSQNQKIIFQRAKSNKNPLAQDGRSILLDRYEPITVYVDDEDLKYIPSNARSKMKALTMGITGFPYWQHFMPKPYSVNLYDKYQGKKHVNVPGTWMFDIMYFSNYGNQNIKVKTDERAYQQAIYLIGININTRFAVGRRINGKTVDDLIPPFQDLLRRELRDKINLLIFDGEKAISSKKFEEFCNAHKINVKITYPGIHTQTAPIDRLCRTLRDYFSKMFLAKVNKGIEYNIPETIEEYKQYPLLHEKRFKEKMHTEALYVRQIFNGEHRSLLAPIPLRYVCIGDPKPHYYEEAKRNFDMNIENDYRFTFNMTQYYIDNYKNDFYTVYTGDELLDVIYYYNTKPHNGLIRIFKAAGYDYNNVTPSQVNESPELEKIIIDYCNYYNKNLVNSGPEYNIGDKVIVYDCFTKDRGNLQRNSKITLMGDWEIISKDGEIYGVQNILNNQILHVSKYMLKRK